ncbi:MAG: rod shape-determining protein MreC [Ignavibacteriales bacterium]|nr:rod shape-determining protein MreC [Ignavibacteriota bacterium]MCB0746884.1 rod shape-determining protein MreC [Ignavibacteriota bacterium]MCB9249277.1 rod shape-determining protein MreC [Ignavibacteriales bacterium]
MPRFISVFLNNFKEYIVLVLLLIISLSLITLNDNHKVKNIRLYALGTFASVNSFLSNLKNFFEDRAYIDGLLKHNAELTLQVNELRNYAYQYEELHGQSEFIKTSKYELISARIVSRLVSKVSGYFIISKGSLDGVTESMPVITDEGLVGIVMDVASNYSTVRTYENSLFKVAVKDQRSGVDGILNWDGKELIIKNVPTTEDVEVGDRVIVSELSTIIPPAIPVGIISSKESTVSGILSNIKVKPYTNVNKIENVLVVKKSQNFQLDSLFNKINGVVK